MEVTLRWVWRSGVPESVPAKLDSDYVKECRPANERVVCAEGSEDVFQLQQTRAPTSRHGACLTT